MFPHRHISRDVDGTPTDIVIQSFADRILVLVTQVGKVGTLIQATIPDTTPLIPASPPHPSEPDVKPLPPPSAAIQLTTLLGNTPAEHTRTLHSLYAAQIATLVWTAESQNSFEVARRSVIVGVALRKSKSEDDGGLSPSERSLFLGIMAVVQEVLSSGR